MLKCLILLLIIAFGSADHTRTGTAALMDTIEDYCDSEPHCSDDVMDDLIWYMTGEAYDDELDAGTSRATILLESIDDKCENSSACMGPLLKTLTDRVLDDPMLSGASTTL